MERDQDIKCIKQVLAGDRNAYVILVDRYKDMVFSLALRMVKSREQAEEIAQDVFVKAFRALGSFKGKSSFSTWLYRITYTTAISSLRTKRISKMEIEEDHFNAPAVAENEAVYTSLNDEERKKYIANALDHLEEEDRFLVVMYYFKDVNLDELAEVTGMTKSNVKVRLYRSRKKMMTYLKSYLKEEIYSLL